MRWLALLLVGCAIPGEAIEMPGQARALEAVWAVAYQRSDPPPTILWVTGDDLDCGDGRGFVDPWTGHCCGGLATSRSEVHVAWPGDGDEAGWRHLAHELWHAVLMRQPRWSGDASYGNGDPGHRGPWWPKGALVPNTEDMVMTLMCDASRGCAVR